MFWSLFFAVFVAVLAAFGLACGIQMIVEACFPLQQIVASVEIQTEADAELLELLLQEARNGWIRRKSSRVGVLLSESLLKNGEIPDEILKLLKKYDADCYLISSSAD